MTAVGLYTLLEMRRRYVLLAFVLLAIGLMLVLGLAPLVVPGAPTGGDRALFLMQSLSGIAGTFVGIVAIGIGMTVIYHDLDSGGAVAIFAKPVSRLAYSIGKVAALAIALAVVVVTMVACALVLLALNGQLDPAVSVIAYFAATLANVLTLALFVLLLTTLINNIVAAVLGFIAVQVTNVITFLHTLVVHNAFTNPLAEGIINVAYWLVPHALQSDLAHRIVDLQLRLHPIPRPPAGSRAIVVTPAESLTPTSGVGDVAFWAAYVLVLGALLFLSLRRRQV